ncbi:DnaJ domain-containing protein [Campylobacter sp. VBCF_05 NA6]|uniref:DnaJ domain-containing protein n=1 Tax=unclassified Campylobacter TaxID=2593542 RepID=UPI0022E9ED73|nr:MULTISPECIES: DnaJ domain-containing protein [unclassified Campylobacter]MDA3058152.1 DnaJ domain-containing protein [Campylobacter sp. VBCF_04 NA7]MDA3059723.1 DnaJ domain-containing protein [Campylobacter sp. VBCF_05 NA6]
MNKFVLKNYDICEKCGAHQQIDEMSKFCIYCGSELNHPYRQRLNFIYDKKPSILVALLAKIAKIDNKPIDRELAKFISMLIDKIDIFYDIADSEFRRIYADIFEYEKNSGRSIAELCNQLTLSNEKEGEFILMLFFDLIYFDGVMTSKEEFLMEQIAVALGIGVLNFRGLRDMFEAKQSHKRHSDYDESENSSNQMDLNEAYKTLGASPNDDTDTIKKKYRALVRKWHTDNFESKDLPPEMQKMAMEQMQKINLAYEIIKKYRGF